VPHAVGKRTPRVPVSYSYKKDYTENYVSPYRRSLKSTTDANDDEVAHVVALALTEAAQRGGSPQVSQSPCRRAEKKPSPVQRWERKVLTVQCPFLPLSCICWLYYYYFKLCMLQYNGMVIFVNDMLVFDTFYFDNVIILQFVN